MTTSAEKEHRRFVSDNSRLLTTETLTSRTHLNDLSGNLRYMWNAKDGFLANVIKFDGSWNNDKVEGVLASQLNGPNPLNYGSERTHQHFNRPSLAVSNTTNLIKNVGKHTLDLHFSAGYAQRPNTLTVGVDSLNAQQEVFNSHVYQQDIESRHINANFHTNYNFHLGNFTLAYGVIANASLHGIETELNSLTPNPSPKERGVYTFKSESIAATEGNHSPLLGRGVGGEAEQILLGTVLADLAAHRGLAADIGYLVEAGTLGKREVGHGVDAVDTLLIQPIAQLLGRETREALDGTKLLQLN